jgi:uncharacterized protein YggL (DUF469 family)
MSENKLLKSFEEVPLELDSIGEFQEVVFELAEQFQIAEDAVSMIAKRLGHQIAPSINQLRYYGYHLSQAFRTMKTEGGKIFINRSHLFSARKHCFRAYYDAFDYATLVMSNEFNQLDSALLSAGIAWQNVYPRYNELVDLINEITELRKTSNEEHVNQAINDISQKDFFYKKLDEKLTILWELRKGYPAVLDAIRAETNRATKLAENEEIRRLDETKKHNETITVSKQNLLITTLGFITALIVGSVSTYYLMKPQSLNPVSPTIELKK